MKEIDATRLKLAAMELVEGTELKWIEVLRADKLPQTYYAFDLPRERYELALGIIEGKPVWEGDELYLDGIKRPFCGSFTDGWSWLPPKPKQKTAIVELLVEDVNSLSDGVVVSISTYTRLVEACCKTRKQLKDWDNFKESDNA